MDTLADGSWEILGVAGALGLCCVGTASLAGGAVVAGGTAAGTTAVSSGAGGLGGILVTALATVVPLVIIGLVLRRRGRQ